MDWLNYHHFYYFWVVAREGTIVKAGEKLRLAHPTISAQIQRLEASLGVKLFARRGRNLVMTESGQVAFRYADEIFSLGRDFVAAIKGHAGDSAIRVIVGVAGIQPPSLVRRFLEPAFDLGKGIMISCRSDMSLDEFLAELALHRIDVVIADRPVGAGAAVRVYSHLLGECSTTLLATSEVSAPLRAKFPASLEGVPFVMPGSEAAVSRALYSWFEDTAIRPRVIAECEDGALAKEFGKAGKGVFAIPSVMQAEVQKQYGVVVVGQVPTIKQQFYAISVERKIKHPAVAAICAAARSSIFHVPAEAPAVIAKIRAAAKPAKSNKRRK